MDVETGSVKLLTNLVAISGAAHEIMALSVDDGGQVEVLSTED